MEITRRGVIASGAALAATAALPSAAVASPVRLRVMPVTAFVGGVQQDMLGFIDSFPGPTLRIAQGATFRASVENGLQDGTLVHWHGLRLPNRMDGVNVLTQEVIPPGRSFDYRFKVPDAGTFWYHSHYLSYEQVGRGLFGALIVEEDRPPDVDHDFVVHLFDMNTDAAGRFYDDPSPEQFAGPGRIGDTALALSPPITVRRGDRLRLRLINPSIDRIYGLSITGISGRIVALDGMPVPLPQSFDYLTLSPGQRCDVIADVVEGQVVFRDSGRTVLGGIAVDGARALRASAIRPLAPNAMPGPRGAVRSADLVMQGGLGGAAHKGYASWALNDSSGLGRAPFLDVPRGTGVRITLRNATGFDHVMHLHGHHFWELDASGAQGDYRDGTLVEAGQSRDILAVFDNPGDWMLHCHMLSHQADGMATWVRVR